jgi:hypothetical protein
MKECKVQNLAEFMKDYPREPSRSGDVPDERARRRVKVRGTNLHRVWWKGRQWAVTAYGIEARDGRYAIEKARLGERNGNWSWPMHMMEKNWVDIADFVSAWLVSLAKHHVDLSPEDVAFAIRKVPRCAGGAPRLSGPPWQASASSGPHPSPHTPQRRHGPSLWH